MANKVQYTPGPWKATAWDDVVSKDGRRIAHVSHGLPAPSDDVDTANARLIAAAPDLLEALDKLITSADFVLADDGSHYLGEVTVTTLFKRLADARAAIAKAESRGQAR